MPYISLRRTLENGLTRTIKITQTHIDPATDDIHLQ